MGAFRRLVAPQTRRGSRGSHSTLGTVCRSSWLLPARTPNFR